MSTTKDESVCLRNHEFMPITLQMMEGKCINPIKDIAFKKLFSVEKFLVSLLNCILRRPEDDPISHIDYCQQEHFALEENGKVCRFDIICTTEKKESIHIEVQNGEETYFTDRLLYYSSLSLDKQGRKGKDWDYHLMPHYTIAICNFALKHNAENNEKYYYSYKLREEDCLHDVLTNALNVIILELPKFENLSSECDTLLKKWLFLLKNMGSLPIKEVQNMFAEEILREFVDAATFEKLTPDEKMMYVMSVLDEQAKEVSQERKIEAASAKAREEGRVEGLEETAKNLKANGVDIALIAKCTGLTLEQIKEF